MQPSSFQQAVINAVSTPGHMLIDAFAGSGKTSTLKMIAKELRARGFRGTIQYLAFSNEIAKEVKPKLEPYNVDVRTCHSWGNQAIVGKLGFGTYAIEKGKMVAVIRQVAQVRLEQEGIPWRSFFDGIKPYDCGRLVDILRLWWKPLTPGQVERAIDHCGLVVAGDWLDSYLVLLTDILLESIKVGGANTEIIDYVDMLAYPLRNKWALKAADIIMVDECQDLSPVMLAMLKTAAKRGSKIIAVGDEKQAIFGFAGGDEESIDRIVEAFSPARFSLPICYRCPNVVLHWARDYVPEIQGTGKEGVQGEIPAYQLIDKAEGGDLVLSRTNAPLVQLMFQFIAQGKIAKIKGRDYSGYMLSIISNVEKLGDWESFEQDLFGWYRKEFDRIPEDDKDKQDRLTDVFECLLGVHNSKKFSSYDHFKEYIAQMFVDKVTPNTVLLCSFHRSKGLEAERVYLLEGKKGLHPPGQSQEANLVYVAITRSLKELYKVPYMSQEDLAVELTKKIATLETQSLEKVTF